MLSIFSKITPNSILISLATSGTPPSVRSLFLLRYLVRSQVFRLILLLPALLGLQKIIQQPVGRISNSFPASRQKTGNNEGLTIGIRFPKDYLIQQNYFYRHAYWLMLPLLVFIMLFLAWKRWGKDEIVTIATEYYPPPNISPGVSGYIIDDRLDRRDLTALVPYWGAGGFLQVKELESSSLFGLVKQKSTSL
jgi:hypothetical protein